MKHLIPLDLLCADKSGDNGYEEKQQSKAEGCSEFPVDSVYHDQYRTSNTNSACQLVGLCKLNSTKSNISASN